MRILLGHEWLDARMGSEKVFEVFLRLFPDADVVTLWASEPWRERLRHRRVKVLLGDPPRRRPELTKAALLPTMPFLWQTVDTRPYDLVLTSQHAFAHTLGALRRGGANLTYVHSTARYVWTPEIDSRRTSRVLAPARAALRAVDRRLARHHASVAVNSSAVRERVRQHWHLDSRVIHPPVELDAIIPRISSNEEPYLVSAGRWVSYKRPDLAIEIGELLRMPVRLVGGGPMANELRRRAAEATVPVDLIESPTDDVFRSVLAGAACFLQPAVEDFGIVTVEALASGTPVACLEAGGALDIVRESVNGALAPTASAENLAQAVRRALRVDRGAAAASARGFSASVFEANITAWVDETLRSRATT